MEAFVSMAAIALFVLALTLSIASGHRVLAHQREQLKQVRSLLLRLEETMRLPGGDWRSDLHVVNSNLDAFVTLTLDKALRLSQQLGVPAAGSLEQLRLLTRAAEELLADLVSLWRVFAGRLFAGVVLASLGRWWLLAALAQPQIDMAADSVMLVAASVLISITLAIFYRLLPQSWLWSGTLTPASAQWLMAHLTGRYLSVDAGKVIDRRGMPAPQYAAALAMMNARELNTGVSLARERKHVVEAWAREAHREDQLQLRRVEDLLPLLELVGIGGASGLVLFYPAMSWLTSVGQ